MSWVDSARFLGVPVRRDGRAAATVPNASADSVTPSISDESLLTRCAERDQTALTILFRRYYALLRMVSLRILRDEYEADDLVQEVFLFVHNQASIYDSTKSTGRSWLVQITYRRAISRRRYLAIRGHYRTMRAVSDVCEPELCGEPDHSLEVETLLARECMDKMMSQLTEGQYETLRLYFYEGYTLAEIGTKLGENLGNVRNHYYRGLEKMRRQMSSSNLAQS
jgi:RNA polymerase sigma-70 factor, ECF subfamily